MKLIWISDIHLNFLKDCSAFYLNLKDSDGECILITGDIAESHNVVNIVMDMEEQTGKPVYFVLGNHDFYGSSVSAVKKQVKYLNYIPYAPIELSRDTILVGVDGWGDCRNGDFENSRMIMNDWLHITDLKKAYLQGMNELRVELQKLADKDARDLKRKVLKGIKSGYTKIIIATHVPPFEEASLHAGRKSTPGGLPFFSSRCLGEAILPIAKRHPHIDFLWFSGHTHSRACYKPCNNMTVRVAKAEYFFPQIEAEIEYD